MSHACRAAGYKRKRESRAVAEMTLDADLSALSFNETFHKRTAQAGAAGFVADSTEAAEYLRQLLLGDAFSGVAHAQVHSAHVLACIDRHAAAAIGVADCV